MIPLIVDGRLTALEAIRQSWRALKGEWIAATLFHFVLYAMAGAGYRANRCGVTMFTRASVHCARKHYYTISAPRRRLPKRRSRTLNL